MLGECGGKSDLAWTSGDTSVGGQPPQDRRIQKTAGGGAGNKGLWQVQTALQEHERRECLPPGFEGKEGGWGKSQERVLGGEVRGGF